MLPAPYYEDETITIYNADSLALLPLLHADHVITDPPYDAHTHKAADIGFLKYKNRIHFAPLDVEAVVPLLVACADRWTIAFCALEMFGAYKAAAPEAWTRAAFWRKANGAPQFTGDRPGQPGEGIAVLHNPKARKAWNGAGKHGFYDFPNDNTDRDHPTEKPEPLMRALVADFTNPGDLILDPFMGSGTTLRAAKDLGRRAIGIEREERYCEAAARRMLQEVFI